MDNNYNQESKKVDFIAKLTYLTTEEGGRKTAANSGYRPQIKFDFDEMITSGIQTFIDKESVLPGETVNAKIKILAAEHFANQLNEGMEFEITEGPKTVGHGKIIQIINSNLKNKI
jgi:translation elongation factor EF-Tu-like GTPase